MVGSCEVSSTLKDWKILSWSLSLKAFCWWITTNYCEFGFCSKYEDFSKCFMTVILHHQFTYAWNMMKNSLFYFQFILSNLFKSNFQNRNVGDALTLTLTVRNYPNTDFKKNVSRVGLFLTFLKWWNQKS